MTRVYQVSPFTRLTSKLRSSTALLIGVLALAPLSAMAQDTVTWQGPNAGVSPLDGNWNQSNSNWTGGSSGGGDDPNVFANGDSAIFTNLVPAEDYIVTIDNGSPVRVVDLTVNGGGLTINAVPINPAQDRTLEVEGTITINDDPLVAGIEEVTINAPMIGDDGITKAGDGTLILTGENEVTGGVAVNGGQLTVNTNLNMLTAGVVVAGGATLSGTGQISQAVTLNGTGSLTGALDINAVVNAGVDSVVNMTGGEILGLATLEGSTTAAGVEFEGGVNNSGTFDVAANTTASGNFTNSGTITNSSNSAFSLGGTMMDPLITFTNTGAITSQNGGATGSLTINATTINLNDGTDVSGSPVGTLNFGGNVNVNGTVDFTNTGAITGDVVVTENAAFDNVGMTSVSGSVTGLGDITISGGQVGTVSISGTMGTFSGGATTGDVDIGGTPTDTVNTVADFNGNFQIGDDLIVQGGTNSTVDVNVTNSSTLTVLGQVDLNGGAGIMSTTLDIDGGSALATTDGVNVGVGTELTNAGTISGGLVSNNGGTITNEATTGIITADVTNTTGMLTNNGDMKGTITINGGTLENNGSISGTDDMMGGLTGSVELDGSSAILTTSGTSDIDVLVTNTEGTITAAGGTFDGGITNFDVLNVTANTEASSVLNTADMSHSGVVTVNDMVTFTADITQDAATASVDVDGTLAGNLILDAGAATLNGSIDGTVELNVAGASLTTGFQSDGMTQSVVGELVTNSGTIDASNTDFQGGILNDDGGMLNVLADITGDVTNDGEGTGVVDIASTATITGNLSTDSGLTTQAGTIMGNVDTTGGVTNNTGEIQGTLLVDGGEFNNQLTTGSITQLTTVEGGELNANGGSFGTGGIVLTNDPSNDGILNLNTSYMVDVTAGGGTVNLAATQTLTGNFTQSGSVTNNRGNIVDADLQISGGELNNLSTITGAVTVTGGQLDMDVDGMNPPSNVTGSVTVAGGTVNANGGTFGTGAVQVNSGNLNVTAATTVNVTNDGGQVTMDAVTLTGDIDNNSGDATLAGTVMGNVTTDGSILDDLVASTANITGTLTVNGGSFTASGGQISQQVTNNGGFLNLNGSTYLTDINNVLGTTVTTANTAVDVDNLGGRLEVRTGTTLTGNVNNQSGEAIVIGTLEGDTTIVDGLVRVTGQVNGTVGLTGGRLNIQSGEIAELVTNNGGEINAEGGEFAAGVQNTTGEFDVIGAVTVSGGDVINTNGTVIVRGTGTLTGDLVQNGNIATNNGTILGTVDVNGGEFVTAGRVSQTVTVNAGTEMTVNNGSSFDVEVQSVGGNTYIEGNTTGNFNIDGGVLRIIAGGDIDGNVRLNSNIVNNNGNIQGIVSVNGGTFSQRSGSDTESLTTVSAGGALNAEGGDFSGGILMAGGTLAVTANTTGDIENDGSSLDLPTSVTLTGDLTNTSGDMIVRSDVIGTVTTNGGTVTFSQSSSVTERSFQNAGTVEINGGNFIDGFSTNGGTTNVNGDVDGKIRVHGTADVLVQAVATLGDRMIVNSGVVDLRGDAGGGVTVKGGTVINSGDVTGKVLVRNNGTFEHDAGNVSGLTVVKGGATVSANGGSFGKEIRIINGTATVTNDTDAKVDVRSNGELILRAGNTLTGNVKNEGSFDLAGRLDGDLINRGTTDFINNGTVLGRFKNRGRILFNGREISLSAAPTTIQRNSQTALTVPANITVIGGELENDENGEIIISGQSLQAGSIDSSGVITISNQQLLLSDNGVSLRDGSVTTIKDGGLEGETINANAGATISVESGDIEGKLTVAGDLISRGSSQMFGDVRIKGEGTLTVRGNEFVIDGFLDTEAETETTLAAGTTLTSNGFTHRGAMSMGDGSTIEGQLTNLGVIALDGSGSLTFAGGIKGRGTVDVSDNGSTSDLIRVGGNGVRGGTYALDIDLGSANGTADRVVITDGVLTGNVTLDFNLLDSGARQNGSVVVIDTNGADTDGLNLEYTGLPGDDGPLVYTVSETNSGNFAVTEGLNPAISGLAGSVVLTQSLIGSVINRPSSPFVSGLALEGEDPCGAGVWARATGGYADSSGNTIDSSLGNQSFSSELELNYGGVQIGGDWACFGGFYDGWDMAFGGIVGANIGKATQPVFGLDGSSDSGFSDELKSVTDFNFTQGYAGVYGTAVKGPIAVDLQYRLEETTFVANNEPVENGVAGLGLNDAEFKSSASTLSGAISYSIPLENSDLTFVPTAGFAYTQISTDPITFDNTGVLEVQDFENQVGFVGGTLARTRFGDDGVSAINQFVTATVYSDFADDPISIFTPDDGTGDRTLTTGNLGTYGELSAGLNYVRILQPGEFGAVRQFNAAVRADVRYSDQLESWGLTAQARLQF